MKRRILSLAMALLMLFSLVPLTQYAYATNTTTAGDESSIPDDAVTFFGHYYMLYNDADSFDSAQQKCVERGGHLATITSAEENNFLYSYIVSRGIKNAYFGFTDAEAEGQWKWVTGETVSYTNWHRGEPNEESSRDDYAMFYYKFTDGTWNDCDFLGLAGNYYICEWDRGRSYNVCLADLECVDEGHYTGNQGDSRVYRLDGLPYNGYNPTGYNGKTKGNGNIGLDGTVFENGFEVWIARWNSGDKISWAYRTFKLGGNYQKLTGSSGIIKSYNTTNYDVTVYFYSDDNLLYSFQMTPSSNQFDFSVDVSGVDELKVLVKDNKTTAGGTSYALYDLFLDQGSFQQSSVPSWYDFFEDSYQFRNYNTVIENQYFETLYGKGKGKAFDLWRREARQGGVCFGMAYTTAALLNGYPACENIRSLKNASGGLFSVSSTVKIGGKTISIRDYINYAHIYQFSSEFQSNSKWSDIDTIYNQVKTCLENNSIGVTIGMTRRDGTGGHRVLAVGLDGDDILIDDPNNTKGYERIIRGDYGSWEFTGLSGWNNITCKLRYSTDFYEPYNLLWTGSTVIPDDSSADADSYIYGMNQLDSELFLLTVANDNFTTASENLTEIVTDDYVADDNNQSKLYWVNDRTGISISGNEEGNSFSLAGNDIIVSAITSDASRVIFADDGEGSICSEINAIAGHKYSLGITSFDSEGNAIEISASGTASCENVSAQKTETGVLISGMNNVTVEYSDCENVIDSYFVPVDDGQAVTIMVDEDTDEITTDFAVSSPFSDVKEGRYFYIPVLWAYYHTPQITSGTSATTFSPDDTCTRAQIVTFLWRAAGAPEPTTTSNPFADVKPGEYYYKAVLWAEETGVTSGTSNTTFSPYEGCTRAQVVTFLWRFAGSPEPTTTTNPFVDVSSGKYYAKAVLWAAEKGVTAGTSATTFSPNSTCTRGQIVTFLYRHIEK